MLGFGIFLACLMLFIRVFAFAALWAMSEMPYDLSQFALPKMWLDEVTIWVGFVCIILVGFGA